MMLRRWRGRRLSAPTHRAQNPRYSTQTLLLLFSSPCYAWRPRWALGWKDAEGEKEGEFVARRHDQSKLIQEHAPLHSAAAL